MGNTLNAILSLTYFHLVKKAWFVDLRVYHICKDMTAWSIFVLLLVFCTASTAVSLSYSGGFLVDEGYCLASGMIYKKNELYVVWVALGMCLPLLVVIGFYSAGTKYLSLYNRRCTRRGSNDSGSRDGGSILFYLKNIRTAVKWYIIS